MSKKGSVAVSVDLLRVFPILQGLSDSVLSQLAQQSLLRHYARRAIVLSAGQHEESLCFLYEGRLQAVDFTVDGREVGMYFVEPNGFCGELGLLDQGEQPEYIVALTRSQVVLVPMTLLREVMHQSPSLMTLLCQRLAGRVRAMTQQRSLLGLPNIAQRVCGQLMMLLNTRSWQSDEQQLIKNPPTHQEIAIMLNLSRETVTRVFQQLQGQKIVKRDGTSRLLIEDPDTLALLAHGDKEL